MTKTNCKRRTGAWLGNGELYSTVSMAIYKPLKVSTIPTMLYNLRSESSIGFELLTEVMLTDFVEETMRLGVDNGRLQLDLNSNHQ